MPRDVREAARAYIARGWRVARLLPCDKIPIGGKDWPSLVPAPEDFGDADNIGVVLGEASQGLADIDLDTPEAIVLAPSFLPPTATFGRPSTPRSHWIYCAPNAKTRKISSARTNFLELRANARSGAGVQTMVPPSYHGEAQELLAWTDDTPVLTIDARELLGRFTRLALATILRRCWPALEDGRAIHDTCLALAGALRRSGWPQERVLELVDAMPPPPDGNAEHRSQAVLATYTNAAEDLPTTGWPRLEIALGPHLRVFKRLAEEPALGHERPAVLELRVDHEPLNDAGNATRLLDRHGQDLRYAEGLGWYRWDGARWAPGDPPYPEAEAVSADLAQLEGEGEVVEKLRKWGISSGDSARLSAMIRVAEHRAAVRVRPADFDRDPFLLGCPNGTLDLRTAVLRTPRREDLVTQQTGVPYDPIAQCPRFMRFLRETLAPELAEYVVRFLGYSLTGDVREHIFNAWWGSQGRNGKSTLMRVCERIWGDYCTTIAPDTLMHNSSAQHTTALVDLRGRRLAFSNETPEGRRWSEDTIKRVTGGDTIKARRMRKDNVEWAPTHKIVIAMNSRPLVREQGPSFWSRIHLVPWEVSFLGREDRTLDAQLEAEAPGILALLVRGALAWQRYGLAPPALMVDALDEYKRSQDTIGAFLAEVTKPQGRTPKAKVYRAYKRWSEDSGERYPLTASAFYRVLAERGFTIRRGGDREVEELSLRGSLAGSV